MIPNLKRNWLVSSKLTWEIWRILTQALENLENLHFNGLLLNKVYNIWPKQIQGSYVWQHWILMQHLKENWLVHSKMRRNLANFHQSMFGSLKIRTLMRPLLFKVDEFKIYRGGFMSWQWRMMVNLKRNWLVIL